MTLRILKDFFIYSIFIFPLSLGIVSCSKNNESNREISDVTSSENIPSVVAVAALGQLSPAGEIRNLAAPISQFGASPRLIQLLVSEGDFVKRGDILAIFENRKKLIADLEKVENLIKTINLEIELKEEQIKRYELALEKDAYSFVQLSQRKDELLKLQKQKINSVGDRRILK